MKQATDRAAASEKNAVTIKEIEALMDYAEQSGNRFIFIHKILP